MTFCFAVFNEPQNFDYYPYYFYQTFQHIPAVDTFEQYDDFLKNGFIEPNYDGYFEVHEAINQWLDRIQDVKIAGVSLPEKLAYNNVSLWPFAKEKFSWWLRPNITAFEYFKAAYRNQTVKIDKVLFVTNLDDQLSEMIKTFCLVEGVLFEYKKNKNSKVFLHKSEKNEGEIQHFDKASRREIGDYIRSKRSSNFEKGRVLLVNMGGLETIEDDKIKDNYLHLFHCYFKNRSIETYRIILPHYPYANKKKYLDAQLNAPSYYQNLFMDEFMDDGMWEYCQQFLSSIELVWEECSKDIAFQNAFSWGEICLLTPFEKVIREILTRYIVFRGIGAMWMASRMLDQLAPKAIFLTNEAFEYSRAIIIEAHRRGIEVVGLQHGAIFRQHWYYLDKNVSAEPDILNKPFYGFIIPKKTFVFGHYFKNVLTLKGHYPDENVYVLPNWIMFSKFKGEQFIAKEQLIEYYGLKRDFILVLSGVFVNENIRLIANRYKKNPVKMVVKLHPNENYAENIVKILQKENYPFVITKEHYAELIRYSHSIYASESSTAVLDVALSGRKARMYGKYKRTEEYPWRYVGLNFDDDSLDDSLTKEEKKKLDEICSEWGSETEFFNTLDRIFIDSSFGKGVA